MSAVRCAICQEPGTLVFAHPLCARHLEEVLRVLAREIEDRVRGCYHFRGEQTLPAASEAGSAQLAGDFPPSGEVRLETAALAGTRGNIFREVRKEVDAHAFAQLREVVKAAGLESGNRSEAEIRAPEVRGNSGKDGNDGPNRADRPDRPVVRDPRCPHDWDP